MKISAIFFAFLTTISFVNGQTVMKSTATIPTFLVVFATVPNMGRAQNLRVQTLTQDIPGRSNDLYHNARTDDSLSEPEMEHTAFELDQKTLMNFNGTREETRRLINDYTSKETKDVLEWIQHEVFMLRNPYCWKRSYSNPSTGIIPGRVADCKPGYINDGATCRRPTDDIYAPSHMASCPRDYTNFGLTCTRNLNTGWCQWYTPWYCDTLSGGPSRMSCKSGYFRCGGRCCKNCPSGYVNTGETCHRPLHVTGLSSMICKSNEDRHGGRCYPKGTGLQGCSHGRVNSAGLCYTSCKAGYYLTTGVCHQKCDDSMVNCMAGCAKSDWVCGEVTADQVVAPFVIIANVVTMGVAAQSSKAVKAAKAGGLGAKRVIGSVDVGSNAIKLAKTVNYVKKGTSKVEYTSELGRKALEASKRVHQLKDLRKVVKIPYYIKIGMDAFAKQFAKEFAEQTSVEIKNELVYQFGASNAVHFFEQWGFLQLSALMQSEGWAEARMALTVAGFADPSGVVDVVNAYTKPKCKEVIPFPCTRFNKNKGCGKLKFADSKQYKRRRLEAAMDLDAIEEEFTTCNGQNYEVFLYVEEDAFHIDMVGKPLDSNSDECKKAFVFDDYDTGEMLISHTEDLGFADDWQKRALSLGTFSLVEIVDASTSAEVINPFEYNLLTNNCASFVIEMMGYLGVPVTKEVIRYVTKSLLKSPDFVEAIRGHASADKILARNGESLESLPDAKLVGRLVMNYAKNHKQPEPTGTSVPTDGLENGPDEDYEYIEEPVENMYEKYAEEHKDEYSEEHKDEYQETVEDEYEKALEYKFEEDAEGEFEDGDHALEADEDKEQEESGFSEDPGAEDEYDESDFPEDPGAEDEYDESDFPEDPGAEDEYDENLEDEFEDSGFEAVDNEDEN